MNKRGLLDLGFIRILIFPELCLLRHGPKTIGIFLTEQKIL